MNFKAFTILEMIINLAIMSIIVSMVYVLYTQFQRNVEDYAIVSQENFRLQSFYSQMQTDFYNCDRVVAKNESSLEVIFYNENKVVYTFINDNLVRLSASHKDTIAVSDFQIRLENDETENASEKLVNQLEFTANLYGEEAPCFLYKNYMSNYLIELK